MPDGDGPLAALEGRSGMLFLVAGSLLVVFAGVNIAQAATDPSSYQDLHTTFGPAGFVFGFLGLLGLYPAVADRSPKLARAGAILVALGAVGFAIIAAGGLARIAGVGPAEMPTWLQPVMILSFLGMLGGVPAFGIATLRSDVHSRRLGLLILVPAAVFAVMLTSPLISTDALAVRAAVISSTQALAHLAIGYTLRNGGEPTDRVESTVDTTA